jgi:hypothetical protein
MLQVFRQLTVPTTICGQTFRDPETGSRLHAIYDRHEVHLPIVPLKLANETFWPHLPYPPSHTNREGPHARCALSVGALQLVTFIKTIPLTFVAIETISFGVYNPP